MHDESGKRRVSGIGAMQRRIDLLPNTTGIRRETFKHVFSMLKSWMGSIALLTKTRQNIRIEAS